MQAARRWSNDGPLRKEHAHALMEKRRSSGVATQLKRNFHSHVCAVVVVLEFIRVP